MAGHYAKVIPHNTARALKACEAAGVDAREYAKLFAEDPRARELSLVNGMGPKLWEALATYYGSIK